MITRGSRVTFHEDDEGVVVAHGRVSEVLDPGVLFRVRWDDSSEDICVVDELEED